MAGAATARRLQQQVVSEGVIAGTVTAVRATLQDILKDPRLRKLEAVYGPCKPGKTPEPGKEPGTPYELIVTTRGPVKGAQTEAESAARTIGSDTINVYAINRRSYRSPKVPLIKAIWVYTGRVDLKTGKAESVRIPVVTVQAQPLL